MKFRSRTQIHRLQIQIIIDLIYYLYIELNRMTGHLTLIKWRKQNGGHLANTMRIIFDANVLHSTCTSLYKTVFYIYK